MWPVSGWKSRAFRPSLAFLRPALLLYNPLVIALLQFAMHLVTILFFIGLAGSAVVVILSFIEDLGELLGEE